MKGTVNMKISTKGRYSVRMMIDLAMNQSSGDFVPLKDIAKRQEISKKYLEQIVPLLTRAGFLKTNRGYQGGYMLTRKPSEYTVGEILRVTEGTLSPDSYEEYESENFENTNERLTIDVWKGLYRTITEYLDSITLQDIIDNAPAPPNNFCI